MENGIEFTCKAKMQTDRRREMTEMHLFDAEAREEEALCKIKVSVHDLTSVQNYVERRANNLPLPTICIKCKVVAVQWADDYCLKLEAHGRVEEMHEYRQVVCQLVKETGVEARHG